jgi:hypothetical protein
MKVLNLSQLPKEQIINLNKVAERIRHPFNNLIAQLAEGKESNIDWITCSVASRSIYVSSLFLNCCKLALVKKILDSQTVPELIVVDSAAMKKVLEDYLSVNHLNVKVSLDLSPLSRIKKKFIPFLRRFYNIYKFLIQYYFWHNKSNPVPVNTNITLLDIYVLEESFTNKTYLDRYYPGIWDYLSDEEQNDFYYMPTFYQIKNQNRVYKSICNNNKNFLIKEAFLQISDYFFAFGHPSRVSRFRFADCRFMSFNIKYLVEEDIQLNSTNGLSIMAILNYLFVKRLKEHGVEVRLLVEWFENQLIDKGLIAGFRKFYSETWTIGYQGFPIPPLIYMKTTELELKTGTTPHEVSVIGRGMVNEAQEFCSSLNITVGPAFRFSNLWRKRIYYPKEDAFYILVALPIGLKEGNEILNLIFALPDELLNKCKITIKPHPTNSQEITKISLGRDWPDQYQFVSGNFADIIEKSHLLISNTSSTCLETLAKGIPVIVVGSQSGLTQNSIPKNITSDIWSLCYTSEEIGQAIDFYKSLDSTAKEQYQILGENIKQAYFQPINKKNVRHFLKLEV